MKRRLREAAEVLGAVLARDARIDASYPAWFFLTFLSVLAQVSLWWFTARWVAHPPRVPGGWFSFLVVGWAFLKYQEVALFTFAQSLREEQLAGTAELLLSTPRSETVIVVALSAWDFVRKTFVVVLFLGIATIFGVRWHLSGLVPAAAALVLALAAYLGVGLLAAAFTVTFRKGMALAVAASSLTTLFGGVIYPVESLGRLRWVSGLVPATYAGRALRSALLEAGTLGSMGADLFRLTLFAALLLPVGALLFRASVARAKREGSLGAY